MLNNRKAIKKWLDEYKIKKYKINDDMTVDVNGNVDLFGKQLTEIPIKFNIVTRCFNCSFNRLTTLIDIEYIDIEDKLCCSNNSYTSFEHWPKRIECWEEIRKYLTKEQQQELIIKEPEWVPIVSML